MVRRRGEVQNECRTVGAKKNWGERALSYVAITYIHNLQARAGCSRATAYAGVHVYLVTSAVLPPRSLDLLIRMLNEYAAIPPFWVPLQVTVFSSKSVLISVTCCSGSVVISSWSDHIFLLL